MAGERGRSGSFWAVEGGGAAIELDQGEISILRSLVVQLLELVGPGPGAADADADPLAELFAEGPSKPPDDPALARLFPDAYEEKADASEFRRFTENDLRARKRDDALSVVRCLDRGGPVLDLTSEESRQWLGTFNDLRLTIGAYLDITEDDDNGLYHLPDDDERKPMVVAYLWLGALQESLVETLMP
ncbi:DUF2017 domain-containing protein [Streptomyces cocklensis]|jgi:hypothetical protein|uniref:DUF2017 domain-containing protein n=1 Tax=Actinacidiphila cocklensis TaxID=887465 RepID=A0A9W4GS92_9ACTN|nr:DUF2017 domain-containing protein [Actinacidiphila cocklensis]MDD1058313.1 DUF2017 domain-containing protein [Actinacidiphila cocklensis]WSX79285.1 DUF2017 domain-containing protein [Streptomyces sp. NBC_00899]CAG6393375.1 conserved hypothetical protein [Actinacidiphila cocklensis]